MPFVLHALVIAAIFVPYMVLMFSLIAYASRTGQHRSDDPPDTGDEEGELMPAAA